MNCFCLQSILNAHWVTYPKDILSEIKRPNEGEVRKQMKKDKYRVKCSDSDTTIVKAKVSLVKPVLAKKRGKNNKQTAENTNASMSFEGKKRKMLKKSFQIGDH